MLRVAGRCLGPDMAGFGYADRPADITYGPETWANQVIDFMDALNIPAAQLVGNSFGGSIALRVAT